MTTHAPYSFAYQPIVDIERREVFAYEALVRGKNGESAGSVFQQVPDGELHAFDRDIRADAIGLAARLGLRTRLSLNVLPQSVLLVPDAVNTTLDAARRHGIAADCLILEVTEGELIADAARFAERMNSFRSEGVKLAIDDFGAGYSGLNLLCDFQPDVLKLDMNLVRGVNASGPRQAVVRAVIQACDDLGIEVIAEGVETQDEFDWFRRTGLRLFQGFLFGRPGFEALAAPTF
ncbi:MAG: EAL domain-containing protein [Steroidobacteraceae bacterium]